MCRTEGGKEYVGLFYRHSKELSCTLLLNPEIMTHAKALLDSFLPSIKSSTKVDETNLSQEKLVLLGSFLDAASKKAGPDLKETITKIKKEFF